MVRRIAFIGGLLLGSGICALTLGAVLTFLFTGKVLAISSDQEHGIRAILVDAHVLREMPTSTTLSEEAAA